MLLENGRCLGFESKFSDAPKHTKSMRVMMETLQRDSLTVTYPGEIDYDLVDNIRVVGLKN